MFIGRPLHNLGILCQSEPWLGNRKPRPIYITPVIASSGSSRNGKMINKLLFDQLVITGRRVLKWQYVEKQNEFKLNFNFITLSVQSQYRYKIFEIPSFETNCLIKENFLFIKMQNILIYCELYYTPITIVKTEYIPLKYLTVSNC